MRERNPLGISDIADFARPRIRIVNREKGAGARAVLDSELKRAGISPANIGGYDRELNGHLEVAHAIASGQADAGITVRVAADAYALEFITLQ